MSQAPHTATESQVGFLYEIKGGSLRDVTGTAEEMQTQVSDHVHDLAYRDIEKEYEKLSTATQHVPDRGGGFDVPAYELCEDSPSMDWRGKVVASIWFAKDGPDAFTPEQLLELESLCTRHFTRHAGALGATACLVGVQKHTSYKYSETKDIEVPAGTPLSQVYLG